MNAWLPSDDFLRIDVFSSLPSTITMDLDKSLLKSYQPPLTALRRKSGHRHKRPKASVNGRPTQRRALRACQNCRARKVRCIVVEKGASCTCCISDDILCIFTENKRALLANFLALCLILTFRLPPSKMLLRHTTRRLRQIQSHTCFHGSIYLVIIGFYDERRCS